jgi:Fic family protein
MTSSSFLFSGISDFSFFFTLFLFIFITTILIMLYREKEWYKKENEKLEQEKREDTLLFKECQKEVEEKDASLSKEEKETHSLFLLNEKRKEAKEERKKKILTLFEEKKEVNTSFVSTFLSLSRSTSFSYLQELEEEGFILRIGGEKGKDVRYTKKEEKGA